MKMKWNWGSKLLVAMILFMLMMIVFVIMSMRQTFFLVEKDYYPKAIEYQDKIDHIQNAKSLAQRIQINNLGDHVELTFPNELPAAKIKGEIMFYRPSDVGKDVVFPISADTTHRRVCNVSGLENGKYIIKIDYQIDDVGYYQEETIFLKIN